MYVCMYFYCIFLTLTIFKSDCKEKNNICKQYTYTHMYISISIYIFVRYYPALMV